MRAYPTVRRHPRAPKGRRAAATVEFALVSLVFFSFIAGLVELGRGLMSNYLLMNAARQGCRAGVVPQASTGEIVEAANDALARGGLSGATVTVGVNGAETDAYTAQPGDRITVTVSVPVTQVTWVPGSRYLKGSLTGRYTLRRE